MRAVADDAGRIGDDPLAFGVIEERSAIFRHRRAGGRVGAREDVLLVGNA